MGGGDGAQGEGPGAALLREAQAQLRAEDYEGALALYQAAASLAPEQVELEGYIDLLRIFAGLLDARIVRVAA